MFIEKGCKKRCKAKKYITMLFVLLLSFAGCGAEEKEQTLFMVSGGGTDLWQIPFNTEAEEAVTYIPHAGDWNRPLGLYSFLATEDMLVLDDSAKHRIAVYGKDASVAYIEMPEEMICQSMGYDSEENILYLFLFDNQAVEPCTYTYCKVRLNEGTELEPIEKVSMWKDIYYGDIGEWHSCSSYLDSRGQIFWEYQYNAHEWLDRIKNELNEIYALDEMKNRLQPYFCSQYGDVSLFFSLYSYHNEAGDMNELRLFLMQGDEIIAYSDVLAAGELMSPYQNTAYMYKKDGQLKVVYLNSEQEDVLRVVSVDFTAVSGEEKGGKLK